MPSPRSDRTYRHLVRVRTVPLARTDPAAPVPVPLAFPPTTHPRRAGGDVALGSEHRYHHEGFIYGREHPQWPSPTR